jgi:glycerol-3-phosphate acyltransferase PlsY
LLDYISVGWLCTTSLQGNSMQDFTVFFIFMLLSYLIGSVSSAIIVCKALKLPDPRQEGSKNPGTTNVLRVGGKFAALLTLLGDFLKGFLPVLIAKPFFSMPLLVCIGGAAVVGHIFPIFYKFKGGKGVATWFGMLSGLWIYYGLSFVTVWIIVGAITGYSSLAAIISAVTVPVIAILYTGTWQAPLLLFVVVLIIIWRHKENIRRLKSGGESKMSIFSRKKH